MIQEHAGFGNEGKQCHLAEFLGAEIADAEPAETDEAEDTDANPSGIEDTQAAFAN